jgi:hypothetical protein
MRIRRAAVTSLLIATISGCVPSVGAAPGSIEPSGSPVPPVAPASTAASPSPVAAAPVRPSPSPPPPAEASPRRPRSIARIAIAPLTGLVVTRDRALRLPIAVMIDDHWDARPQSGFEQASVVWHAPAEGGIPRYMLVFAEGDPPSVGPVRSARQYYIAWAAEWRALYVHSGGSPQALATLRAQGRGQLVWNADEFRWGNRYLWRTRDRFAPHNVYTDAANLRAMQATIGAPDFATPPKPAWQFGRAAPMARRPVGGRIDVVYAYNTVTYRYDRLTNTYRRSVTDEPSQADAGTGAPVAPTNVVVMVMHFGPLRDGQPQKRRLEAQYIGQGKAWISTNGRTTVGTWRKDAETAPTQFFDAAGRPVTLTVGQTFIQVVAEGAKVSIADGRLPVAPRPEIAPVPR